MSDLPLISVVIPNHNYGSYLPQALDSVLAQTHRSLDIIVVDDGSTDHSRDILRRYEGRLRVICQPRQGVSAARNRGVLESRGELLAFLDADDVWLPGKLARQVERLRAEPDLGLMHCGAQLIDPAGRVLTEVTEGVAGRVTADLLQFRRSGVVTGGSGMLLSREIFEDAGGFDPRLSTSADWDFFYRVGLRRPFGFIAEPLVQMRVHEANMRSNIRAMEHDMLLAFEKAFQDPALEIRRLRRKAYGTLHLVLAGCFFRAGRWGKGVAYAWRSVLTWPPAGVTMASRLARRLWRPSTVTVRGQAPRVLYLSYDGALTPLGQSQVVAYLRGLAGRGAAITLLSFEKPEDLRDPARAKPLQRALDQMRIRWTPLRYHRAPALLGTVWDLLTGTVQAWRIARGGRIACVHARSYVAALIAWGLKRVLGVRVLFDMRGFWADERLEGRRGSAGLTYRLMKRLERCLLQEADEVVTLTHEARRTVESWLNGRCAAVTVIPTCVDLERFALAAARPRPVQAPVFIYAGSIAPWYVPAELLRWMGQARRRWPTARLVLVTRQRTAALRAVRESNVDPEAIEVVSAEPAEIPHWLAQADAGLAFYQPGFSRKGTCPTKIGEYLAVGLPVVVNAGIGDVEELIGEEGVGVVVANFSTEAFERAREKLTQLWADPSLAARCRRVAERAFSLQMGIERYWAIYERLASKRLALERSA